MKLSQDAINALATKHGLIANRVEAGSDGTQRVTLERDVKDDIYCQALLRVNADGSVHCHTGLYRERCIIDDGEVIALCIAHAVKHAAWRFDHLVDCEKNIDVSSV